MLIYLFFCTIVLLSVELMYTGKVMGFFQKKLDIKDIINLLMASFIVAVFLIIGSFIGKSLVNILAESNTWYAATILFILGIKMFYNGVKLHKAKQLINPLDNKGLIVLAILVGLNAFFVGISFGLMQISSSLIFASFSILFAGLLLGYSMGLKLKNLNPHRYEFLLGIIYIIIALFFVIKY